MARERFFQVCRISTNLTVELELTERRLRTPLLFCGGGGMTMLRRLTFGESTLPFKTLRRRVFIAGESTLRFAVLLVISAMSLASAWASTDATLVTSSSTLAGTLLNLSASSLNSASGLNCVSTLKLMNLSPSPPLLL
jgi:hypothetical protein